MLHWDEIGDGPPLVLVHGLAASARDWQGLAPVLSQVGFRVLAVDLPGHGASPKSPGSSDYYLTSLYRAFETWLFDAANSDPMGLIGHSLGGYLCLKYSLRWPERVRALVLLDPLFKKGQLSLPLRFLHLFPSIWGTLLEFTPYPILEHSLKRAPMVLGDLSDQVRRQAVLSLKQSSPHILHSVRHISNLSPQLGMIRAPTLIIWGEQDHTLKPSSFLELSRLVPGAQKLAIPHCGHHPHFSRSDLVLEAVSKFLEKIYIGEGIINSHRI